MVQGRAHDDMDPHEDVNLGSVYPWAMELGFKTVKEYGQSVMKYPNPPAPNLTRFTGK